MEPPLHREARTFGHVRAIGSNVRAIDMASEETSTRIPGPSSSGTFLREIEAGAKVWVRAGSRVIDGASQDATGMEFVVGRDYEACTCFSGMLLFSL